MKTKKWTKQNYDEPKKEDEEESDIVDYDPWDEERIKGLQQVKKTNAEWMREAEWIVNTITRKQKEMYTKEEIINDKIETIDLWVRAKRLNPTQGEQIKERIMLANYKTKNKYSLKEKMYDESSENYDYRNKDLTAKVINFGKQSQSTINPQTMEITNKFYKQTVNNLKNWFGKKDEPKEEKKGHKKSQSRNVLLNQILSRTQLNDNKEKSPQSTKSEKPGVKTRGMTLKELKEKEEENKKLFQSNKKKKKTKKDNNGNFTEEVEDILERRYSDPIKNFTQTTTFYDKAKKYFDKARNVMSTVDTVAKMYAYGTMAATALYHGYNMINFRRYNRNNNLPGAPGPI